MSCFFIYEGSLLPLTFFCHSEEGEARRGNPFPKGYYGLPRAFSPRNDILNQGCNCRGDSRIARLWAENDRPYDSLPPSKLRFATSLVSGRLLGRGGITAPHFSAGLSRQSAVLRLVILL